LLNVQTILEGSVQRNGNRIRVTAQLIDGSDGSSIWSERFDRVLTDVFEIQDDIAAAIAGALRVNLDRRAGDRSVHHPALPAYEAYLKGLHHFSRTTQKGSGEESHIWGRPPDSIHSIRPLMLPWGNATSCWGCTDCGPYVK
jgi:hypothetical protein